jgi:hypothetical protein
MVNFDGMRYPGRMRAAGRLQKFGFWARVSVAGGQAAVGQPFGRKACGAMLLFGLDLGADDPSKEAPARFCSQIPGLGSSSRFIFAGSTVLFAVKACSPHDGVGLRG